jgi:hypothetical protein
VICDVAAACGRGPTAANNFGARTKQGQSLDELSGAELYCVLSLSYTLGDWVASPSRISSSGLLHSAIVLGDNPHKKATDQASELCTNALQEGGRAWH